MALTVGSLFSGLGGIDLGLERAGMGTRWFCEIDPHCRNVLARHWPGLPVYGDIAAVDWSGVEPVDVLAGGFPCQPISAAGNQLAQLDERWLWPEFARAVRELRPRYVLVENVRNLLAVNGGSAFAEVLGSLAASGFDAEWDCIPASAVGAPHQRDRLWLVAHAGGRDGGSGRSGRSEYGGQEVRQQPYLEAASGAMADATGPGRSGRLSRNGRRLPAAEDGERRGQPTRRGAGDGPAPLADAEGQPIGPGLRAGGTPAVGRRRPGDGGGEG